MLFAHRRKNGGKEENAFTIKHMVLKSLFSPRTNFSFHSQNRQLFHTQEQNAEGSAYVFTGAEI